MGLSLWCYFCHSGGFFILKVSFKRTFPYNSMLWHHLRRYKYHIHSVRTGKNNPRETNPPQKLVDSGCYMAVVLPPTHARNCRLRLPPESSFCPCRELPCCHSRGSASKTKGIRSKNPHETLQVIHRSVRQWLWFEYAVAALVPVISTR